MWWGFREKRRIAALEEQLLRLERRFEGLELDWLETYQKLKKTMGRIVKSEAIIRDKEAALEAGGNGVEQPLQRGEPPAGFLTPRQKLIQQQILQRRAGSGMAAGMGGGRALLPG